MKTAFVFPGQGAQYIGMAMDYVAADPELAEILRSFDQQHQTDLAGIMANGPEDLLKETRYTQPAILFHSICALRSLRKLSGIKPDYVAGHSLGEFTAMVAAGVLSETDGMHLVHKRGEFMIKANEGAPFAMAAIIGLEADAVIEVCKESESLGLVRAVNFNTPIQTVISGSAAGVQAAMELAKSRGAKRALPLVVGGPFHTPMIQKAGIWLEQEMRGMSFADAACPVVSNVDALPDSKPEVLRQKLVRQITSPVRWVESIRNMREAGVTRFIEFGPQKVLSGMIKNIDKDAEVFSVDKLEEVAVIAELLS
ncbi:MAG TPA: ACP S-malonyltransferase [Candidatus Cloacimonadota bacterium]|nr:ACP S-malonyltransferase [Candidatus Cloacimonadota bacterium]